MVRHSQKNKLFYRYLGTTLSCWFRMNSGSRYTCICWLHSRTGMIYLRMREKQPDMDNFLNSQIVMRRVVHMKNANRYAQKRRNSLTNTDHKEWGIKYGHYMSNTSLCSISLSWFVLTVLAEKERFLDPFQEVLKSPSCSSNRVANGKEQLALFIFILQSRI